MPASQAPALARDWVALLDALAARGAPRALQDAPRRVAMGVLAAPVAVARWIVERAPELARRDELRLAVIGAEKLDAVDAGRWYQLLPLLLGRAQRIEVTLIGQELAAGFVSPLQAAAPQPPARAHAAPLAQLAGMLTPDRFDLAFLFHPGFPRHRGWLADASLARVVAAGVPVAVASYELDEYEMDRWVVECHGFEAAGEALVNPLAVDLGTAAQRVHWGRVLWRLAPGAPAPGQRADEARLEALDELGRMVMHSLALGEPQLQAYGAWVEGRLPDGKAKTLIYVFDRYFVDPADARLLAWRDGSLQPLGAIPAAALAAHPGRNAAALAAAVWAADLKAKYLLASYPAQPDERVRQAHAASMHADLQAKVEALFSAPPDRRSE